MIAFSTSWNASRHQKGEPMLREILGLGCSVIELGHGLKVSLLEDIFKFQQRGDIRVISLHNYCPQPLEIPIDNPDCYELTSHREDQRRRALLLTKKTIDLAAQLKASHVIIHTGIIRTKRFTRKILAMLKSEAAFGKDFGREKVSAVLWREKTGPFYLERLRPALMELLEYASERNIRLSVENRIQIEAVPSEREMADFLDGFSGRLGYWHDFGHAHIKENFGWINHRDWLQAIAPRLTGAHVQDAAWPNRDHLTPFSGAIDFAALYPLLPQGAPIVWELNSSRSKEEISSALERWQALFAS